MGFAEWEFVGAYAANREGSMVASAEGSAVVAFMKKRENFEGSMTELYAGLNGCRGDTPDQRVAQGPNPPKHRAKPHAKAARRDWHHLSPPRRSPRKAEVKRTWCWNANPSRRLPEGRAGGSRMNLYEPLEPPICITNP
jgi:hypothetical protein